MYENSLSIIEFKNYLKRCLLSIDIVDFRGNLESVFQAYHGVNKIV